MSGATMWAVRVHRFGGPEELVTEEAARPGRARSRAGVVDRPRADWRLPDAHRAPQRGTRNARRLL